MQNELQSDTGFNVSYPKQNRIVVATNGSNTDIDCDYWLSSGSPPGTPQTQFSGAVNVALQGKSGYGGVFTNGRRGETMLVDNLLFTSNDVEGGPGPSARGILFG